MTKQRANLRIAGLLKDAGVVDTHFHIGPEFIQRRYDIAGISEAVKAWDATLVLKNHTYPTTPLASYARRHHGVRLLGGIVLNRFVGGLNPDAVWSAASGNRTDVLGERPEPPFVVWMPTVHAESHLRIIPTALDTRWGDCLACTKMAIESGGKLQQPVRVFDSDMNPLPELGPVLKAIAQAGARLATGHLSAPEIMKLVPLALQASVPAVVLTHPHYPSVDLSDEQLCELVDDERVFIEHCFAIHTIEHVPLERFIASIKATGTRQVILSTDFGQAHSDPFPDCTERFVSALQQLDAGIGEEDLVRMCSETPRRALGLSH